MGSLRNSGVAVAHSFAEFFASRNDHEILNELHDKFQLWSANLGLFQTGHASLDWRLRESPKVESVIRRFLVDLDQNIQQANAFHGDQLLQSSTPDINEMEKTLDHELLPGEAELADAGYESIQSSDNEAFHLALKAANETLDALFRVAAHMRNSSNRKFKSREKESRNVDPATGVDLIEVHEVFDRMFLLELFSPAKKYLGSENPVTQDEIDRRGSQASSVNTHYLLIRALEAMKLRRRRFGLLRRHKQKMVNNSEPPHITHAAPPNVKQAPFTGLLTHSEHHKSIALHSLPTTATTFQADKTSLGDSETIVSISQYTPSNGDVSDSDITLPSPPQISPNSRYFECPYCFILCSRKYLEPRAWRTHVLRDLSPYMCTYEVCSQADHLFTTRREWVAHEDYLHRGGGQHTNETMAEILSHLDHENEVQTDKFHDVHTNLRRESLRDENKSLLETDRDCPICKASLKSKHRLQNHIASHLERIAIFSLPRPTEVDENDAQDQDQISRAAIQSNDSRHVSSLSSLHSSDSDEIERNRQLELEREQENVRRAKDEFRLLQQRENGLIARERTFQRRQEQVEQDDDRRRIEDLQKPIEELKYGSISGLTADHLDANDRTMVDNRGNEEDVMSDVKTQAGKSSRRSYPHSKDFLHYEFSKNGVDWSGDATMYEIPAFQIEIKRKVQSHNKNGTATQHLSAMGPNRRAHIDRFLKIINAKEVDGAYWEPVYIDDTETRRKEHKTEVKAFEVIFARKYPKHVPGKDSTLKALEVEESFMTNKELRQHDLIRADNTEYPETAKAARNFTTMIDNGTGEPSLHLLRCVITNLEVAVSDIMSKEDALISFYILPQQMPSQVQAHVQYAAGFRVWLDEMKQVSLSTFASIFSNGWSRLKSALVTMITRLQTNFAQFIQTIGNHYDLKLPQNDLSTSINDLLVTMRNYLSRVQYGPLLPRIRTDQIRTTFPGFCSSAIALADGRDTGLISRTSRASVLPYKRLLEGEDDSRQKLFWKCPSCEFVIMYHLYSSTERSISQSHDISTVEKAPNAQYRPSWLVKCHLVKANHTYLDGFAFGCPLCHMLNVPPQGYEIKFQYIADLMTHLWKYHGTRGASTLVHTSYGVAFDGKMENEEGRWDLNFVS